MKKKPNKVKKNEFSFLQKFEFGTRLKVIAKNYIEENYTTKEAFAKHIGLDRNTLNRAEKGDVTDQNLKKVCSLLELNPDEMTKLNVNTIKKRILFLWNENPESRTFMLLFCAVIYALICFVAKPTLFHYGALMCLLAWALSIVFNQDDFNEGNKIDIITFKAIKLTRWIITPVLAVAYIIMI